MKDLLVNKVIKDELAQKALHHIMVSLEGLGKSFQDGEYYYSNDGNSLIIDMNDGETVAKVTVNDPYGYKAKLIDYTYKYKGKVTTGKSIKEAVNNSVDLFRNPATYTF